MVHISLRSMALGLLLTVLSTQLRVIVAAADSWYPSGKVISNAVLGSPIALEIFNNEVYAAFRGSDGNLYAAVSSDGISWPNNPELISGSFPPTPITTANVALRVFAGTLFMAIQSADNHMWLASYDGTSWKFHGSPMPTAVLGSALALEVFNNQLYVAFRGTNNGLYVASSADGFIWPLAAQILPTALTHTSVSLRAFAGKLFMAIQGEDFRLYIASYDGNSWSFGPVIPTAALGSAPVLEVFNNQLYIVLRGTDNAIYFASSTDGLIWPTQVTKILPGYLTQNSLGLRAFGTKLFLAIESYDHYMFLAWDTILN